MQIPPFSRAEALAEAASGMFVVDNDLTSVHLNSFTPAESIEQLAQELSEEPSCVRGPIQMVINEAFDPNGTPTERSEQLSLFTPQDSKLIDPARIESPIRELLRDSTLEKAAFIGPLVLNGKGQVTYSGFALWYIADTNQQSQKSAQ